jgi:disulfide bond formation protein DsbB
MTHAIVSPPGEDADISAASSPDLLSRVASIATQVALLAALLATAGSWFLSARLGWIPCTLCWYQRILMYPLSIVLLVGVLRRERRVYQYVLPFSLWGAGVAMYHYLLQKTDWFPPPACTAGVPCTVDYINLYGFVTVPFLALVAFLIITVAMFISMLAGDETPVQPRSARGFGWDRIAALAIVVGVAIAYRVTIAIIF